MRQQARPGRGRSRGPAPAPRSPCRRPGRTSSRAHAGSPPPSRGQALEAARHIVEGLGHLLADPAQRTAAMRAGAGGRVTNFFAREMLGQAVGRDRHLAIGSNRQRVGATTAGFAAAFASRSPPPASTCARVSTATPSSARGQTNRPRPRRTKLRSPRSPRLHATRRFKPDAYIASSAA